MALFAQADSTPSCVTASNALKSLVVSKTHLVSGNPMNKENTTITFLLHNSAVGVDVNCTAAGAELTPQGSSTDPYKWWECESVTTSSAVVTAAFQWDTQIVQLTVNESWVCLTDSP